MYWQFFFLPIFPLKFANKSKLEPVFFYSSQYLHHTTQGQRERAIIDSSLKYMVTVGLHQRRIAPMKIKNVFMMLI